jgi:hypothetical protein
MMSWITLISVVSKAVMALMLNVCDVYHVIISAMYMISSWLRCEWYLWLTWWQCYLWCLWCGDDCDIYYFLDDCITRDVFDVRDAMSVLRELWCPDCVPLCEGCTVCLWSLSSVMSVMSTVTVGSHLRRTVGVKYLYRSLFCNLVIKLGIARIEENLFNIVNFFRPMFLSCNCFV